MERDPLLDIVIPTDKVGDLIRSGKLREQLAPPKPRRQTFGQKRINALERRNRNLRAQIERLKERPTRTEYRRMQKEVERLKVREQQLLAAWREALHDLEECQKD